MMSYLARRLLTSLPSLIIIMVTLFFLSHYQDVDPVERELSVQYEDDSESSYNTAYANLYREKGLQKPMFYLSIAPRFYPININSAVLPTERHKLKEKLASREYLNTLSWWDKLPAIRFHGVDNQFHNWVGSYFSGTLGNSYIDGKPVLQKISRALMWTVILMGLSLIISVLLGIPLGVYLALKPEAIFRKIVENVLFFIYAIPVFWLATLMIIFLTTPEYGRWTDIFPTVGIWDTFGKGAWAQITGNFSNLILPIFILALGNLVYIANLVKNALIEERKQPYFLTLRAKGLDDKAIYRKHLLPNAMMPIITLLAGAIPLSLTGSLIIEVIFNIPGMGRLLYASISKADCSVVYPIVLFIAVVTIVTFALADVLLYLLFPKSRSTS